ncbi:MAG TPA: hypothetical protein DD640_07720 [Clostridiales bacterium]|nr:hypothetical protein [Clostridiales bacterium]
MIKTMITAHSGCEGTPDNSLEYIQCALQMPLEGLEIDVRTDGAGTLVLAHDKMHMGKKPVTLSEAFKYFRDFPQILINCDLKQRDLEIPVHHLACQLGVGKQLVFSGTVDPGTWPLKKLTDVQLFLNVDLIVPYACQILHAPNSLYQGRVLERIHKTFLESHASCLNMNYQFCTDDCMACLNQMEMPFSLWTPDLAPDIIRLLNGKAYNITTRQPRLALDLRRDRNNLISCRSDSGQTTSAKWTTGK